MFLLLYKREAIAHTAPVAEPQERRMPSSLSERQESTPLRRPALTCGGVSGARTREERERAKALKRTWRGCSKTCIPLSAFIPKARTPTLLHTNCVFIDMFFRTLFKYLEFLLFGCCWRWKRERYHKSHKTTENGWRETVEDTTAEEISKQTVTM